MPTLYVEDANTGDLIGIAVDDEGKIGTTSTGSSGSSVVTISGITTVTIDGSANFVEKGADNYATGQVTISGVAALIAASRATRRSILVVNHGTTDVFLGNSGVTTSNGIKLKGTDGAGVSIPVTPALYGITTGTAQTVSYIEIYD